MSFTLRKPALLNIGLVNLKLAFKMCSCCIFCFRFPSPPKLTMFFKLLTLFAICYAVLASIVFHVFSLPTSFIESL